MALPGIVTFFIVIILLALIGFGGWIVFTHLRARRLGLPTPALSSYNPFNSSNSYSSSGGSGGIAGWVKDKIATLRNKGSRGAGGYEEPLGSFSAQGGGRSGRRGFGALDPDDAWDARVGTEADAYGPGGYYEEAEIGLHDTGYAGNVHGDNIGRGRAVARDSEDTPYIGGSQRGLDQRYDEEMGSGGIQNKGKGKESNPFDDEAEIDLRGVSPRPVGDERMGRFREDV